MGYYRHTRAIEASIIEFLRDRISLHFSGVSIEKSFSRIYEIALPSLWVRVGTTSHPRVEIGGNSTKREPQVLIDIFGSNEGNKLDLKDCLIAELKNGMPYYDYEIEQGQIKTKTQNGRITILTMNDTPINFTEDRDTLDIHDRYRHLITLSVSIGKVET